MQPILAPTRDAVMAAIVAANAPGPTQLTPTIAPVALYDIHYNLKDLATDRLVVCPSTIDAELLSRGRAEKCKASIDVAVQHKCGVNGPTNTELDPYMNLVEKLKTLLIGSVLPITFPDDSPGVASCIELKFPHGAFLQEHLKDLRVFTSVITASFTVAQTHV